MAFLQYVAVKIDVLIYVATGHDVVERVRVFDAEGPGHESSMSDIQYPDLTTELNELNGLRSLGLVVTLYRYSWRG